jgi:hypothetical protein
LPGGCNLGINEGLFSINLSVIFVNANYINWFLNDYEIFLESHVEPGLKMVLLPSLANNISMSFIDMECLDREETVLFPEA